MTRHISITLQFLLASLPLLIWGLLFFVYRESQIHDYFWMGIMTASPSAVSLIYIPVYRRIGQIKIGIIISISSFILVLPMIVDLISMFIILPALLTGAIVGVLYYSRTWNKNNSKLSKVTGHYE